MVLIAKNHMRNRAKKEDKFHLVSKSVSWNEANIDSDLSGVGRERIP